MREEAEGAEVWRVCVGRTIATSEPISIHIFQRAGKKSTSRSEACVCEIVRFRASFANLELWLDKICLLAFPFAR